MFHKLVSATTRPMRPGEADGRDYYFRSEADFDSMKLATRLWVNETLWMPGKPKWLYGAPEFEVRANLDKNLVYDVIQPRYAYQLKYWFFEHNLHNEYDIKTLYFIPPHNSMDIARKRANMPDDDAVRTNNTCEPSDILNAGLDIDFMAKCNTQEVVLSPRLKCFLLRYQMIR